MTKRIAIYDVCPAGYGLVRHDMMRREVIVALIPLNIVLGLLDRLWEWAINPFWGRTRLEKRDAEWVAGLRERTKAIEAALEAHFEERVTAALDQRWDELWAKYREKIAAEQAAQTTETTQW